MQACAHIYNAVQGILGPYDAVRALEAKVDGLILRWAHYARLISETREESD